MKDYSAFLKGRDFVHQVGFYSPNWRQFALRHHELFGSGPFYFTTNTFGKLLYYGEEVDCVDPEFHACYGAWGSHSIEVVEQVPVDTSTMFTDENDMTKPGFSHLHMFVDDLEEAQDACAFLKIPVVTVGYSNLEASLEKAKAIGADLEQVKQNAGKASFMVVDTRDKLGFMLQFVTSRAKAIHDLLIESAKDWDGVTDVIRPLGG